MTRGRTVWKKLTSLQHAFKSADRNGDGKLNRQEIAAASYEVLNAPEGRTTKEVNTALLFATFLQGGKDGCGLFPDFDGDQNISFQELKELATKGGKEKSIDSADFRAAFPSRFQEGGRDVDIAQLGNIAQGDKSYIGQIWQNTMGHMHSVLQNLLEENAATPPNAEVMDI
jgi:hypothetical protein